MRYGRGGAALLTWLHLPQVGKHEAANRLIALMVLGGSWLFAIGIAKGVGPCVWCWAYWACIAFLAVHSLFTRRKGFDFLPMSLVAGLSLVAGVGYSAEFRYALALAALDVSMPQYGPTVGSRLQVPGQVLDSGVVVLTPSCLPCARASLERAIPVIAKRADTVTIVLSHKFAWLPPTGPNIRTIRADASFFSGIQMREDGSPLVVTLKRGRITSVETPAVFLQSGGNE